MFYKSLPKRLIVWYTKILNNKITYFILLVIILIQFILVGIIFFQNKKTSESLETLNINLAGMQGRQAQINEKFNYLQSIILRMESQLYRAQSQ